MEKFISEAALKKPASVAEYNELLHLWLERYYHVTPHSGLGGISPQTAFGTDTRPLKFVSVEQLREAFMHKESRKVDKTGCISFNGQLYEVGLAYLGRRVGIWFDPSWQEEIEVRCPDALPFIAKKLVIGENCGVKTELPEAMKGVAPKTSRMLDALQKEHDQNPQKTEVATSFKEFWEGGEEDV